LVTLSTLIEKSALPSPLMSPSTISGAIDDRVVQLADDIVKALRADEAEKRPPPGLDLACRSILSWPAGEVGYLVKRICCNVRGIKAKGVASRASGHHIIARPAQ
jgi:hypothetical protein